MPRTAWNKRLTPEIERAIIAQYQAGMAATEILKSLPFRTAKTVYDVLERNAIPRRAGVSAYKTYRHNEGIFANVDTPEKAYWLGMLIADGYIIDLRKDCEPQIGLQLIDRDLVEQFGAFLGTNRPAQIIKRKNDNCQTMYRVVIHSKRMAADLERYGVVPRKTQSTFLPILDKNLMPHLVRGLLDGDGTISHRHDGGVIIGFCGSERLVTELRIWLICNLGVSDNRIHRLGSIASVQWSSRSDVQKIVQYLYAETGTRLERKFVLVGEYL
jgi:hypothetical protein